MAEWIPQREIARHVQIEYQDVVANGHLEALGQGGARGTFARGVMEHFGNLVASRTVTLRVTFPAVPAWAGWSCMGEDTFLWPTLHVT